MDKKEFSEIVEDQRNRHQKEMHEHKKSIIDSALQLIHDKINELDLNISDEGRARLDEFVIGKIQLKFAYPSNVLPYSNLILSMDESEFSEELIGTITKAIGMAHDPFEYTIIDGDRWTYRLMDNEERAEFHKKLITKDLICIKNFEAHPSFNYDTASTGSESDRQRKLMDQFKRTWKFIVTTAQTYPNMSFIIVTNKYVWESFRKNAELYYRTFRHHIKIQPMTREQVYKRCIDKLRGDGSVRLSDDFEDEFKKYMDVVYEEADLKGLNFVDDMLNRIYALYFAKLREDNIISPECIPKYNADVQTPEMIVRSFEEMVGMEKVAKIVKGIYGDILFAKSKGDSGIRKKAKHYHMVFTGNPGTGKTTVARMLGDLFFSMGLIDKRKVVETKPSDMISGWRGISTQKTKQKLDEARGGVLFIDEAYGFVDSEEPGKQALDDIIVEMENHPDDIIVIMAGYKNEMQRLFESNSGLKSRFAYEIEFEDYSVEDLKKIFYGWLKEEGFSLEPSADQMLEDSIYKKKSEKFFGNARDVRNIYDELVRNWALRVHDKSFDDKLLRVEDFEGIVPKRDDFEIDYTIDDMVGMTGLKDKIEEFKKQVIFQRYLKEHGMKLPEFSMHMVFTGNPGTGKTTVAKMIAKELYSIGILKTDKLVVAEKKDLVAGYIGQTPMKTAEIIDKAMNGVLFIDEAYSLNDSRVDDKNGFGHEAIETLITAMEEHKDSLLVIFAGYVDEMRDFLNMNPGISSRIGYTFDFEDYKHDELVEIYKRKMEKFGFKTTDGALKKIDDIMYHFSAMKNFGNGRFVDNVIHQILLNRAKRFDINNAGDYRNIIIRDIPSHKEIIDAAPNKSELYDPSKITKEEHRITAIHECGHAVVMYVTGLQTSKAHIKDYTPKSVSVKSQVGSLGRVTLPERSGNMSELDMRNEIAILLAGRNAERVFYGYNSTGVSSDYKRAKRLAENMIKVYAMGEMGKTTAMSILKDEDARSTKLIEENKDFISHLADMLLDDKETGGEITGEEFVKLYKKFHKK